MTVAEVRQRHTPEELLAMPDGKDYELVDGELVERHMGTESGWVGGQLFKRLEVFNDQARLGWVFPADVGYQCFRAEADRVRKPDVSFVRYGRLPDERIPRGHTRIPPDLAVEVVSPNDLYGEVRLKVEEYLAAGVPLVWVIDPDTRTIEVLRADGSGCLLRQDAELNGEDVLPGFRCRIADLFPSPEPNAK